MTRQSPTRMRDSPWPPLSISAPAGRGSIPSASIRRATRRCVGASREASCRRAAGVKAIWYAATALQPEFALYRRPRDELALRLGQSLAGVFQVNPVLEFTDESQVLDGNEGRHGASVLLDQDPLSAVSHAVHGLGEACASLGEVESGGLDGDRAGLRPGHRGDLSGTRAARLSLPIDCHAVVSSVVVSSVVHDLPK